MSDERKNITWTERHEKALQAVHEKLVANGVVFEKAGKPNASAILLYLMEQELRRKK